MADPTTIREIAERNARTLARKPSRGLLTGVTKARIAGGLRGGPVALAYSRFDDATKEAVHAEYLRSIAAYRTGEEFRIPGEFVVAVGVKPPPI